MKTVRAFPLRWDLTEALLRVRPPLWITSIVKAMCHPMFRTSPAAMPLLIVETQLAAVRQWWHAPFVPRTIIAAWLTCYLSWTADVYSAIGAESISCQV